MLKLSQIKLIDTVLVVKGFEPQVATHVGEVAKSDETIQRDKDNATHILAEILKVGVTPTNESEKLEVPNFHIGQIVLIPRHSITPLSMPIEGFKEREIGLIGYYSVVAEISTDNAVPLMDSL